MATVNFSPIFNGWQGFTPAGLPLSGGLVNTYLAGTSTPAATYTTSLGNVANPNPIQLGPDGRTPAEIWLVTTQAYKFVLTDSLSNAIATYDNIVGIVNAPSAIWISSGVTPTFISATQFSVPGNLVSTFQVGLRLQYTLTASQFYGSVTASSFGAGITTVTVLVDSVPLAATLNAVNISQLTPDNGLVPVVIEQLTTFQKGVNTGNSAQAALTTLDWYEEGPFTPTILGLTTAGVTTYSLQSGRFQRVGNTVNFELSIQWTAATGTGIMAVGGFPYPQAAGSFCGIVAYFGSGALGTPPFGLIQVANQTYMGITDGAGNTITVKNAALFTIQGFYRV